MTIEEIEQQHSGAAYIVTRDIETCGESLKEGDLVFPYRGYTYGSITPAGVAVTRHPNHHPFFEIPLDAVRTVGID